jgi:hypothetical protein
MVVAALEGSAFLKRDAYASAIKMHEQTYCCLQSKILKLEMLEAERLTIFLERLERSERGATRRRAREEFWT